MLSLYSPIAVIYKCTRRHHIMHVRPKRFKLLYMAYNTLEFMNELKSACPARKSQCICVSYELFNSVIGINLNVYLVHQQ